MNHVFEEMGVLVFELHDTEVSEYIAPTPEPTIFTGRCIKTSP